MQLRQRVTVHPRELEVWDVAAAVIPGLVVDALAAYRLTRLVTADTITEGPRDAIVRWAYRRAGRPFMADGDVSWSEIAMADDDPPKLATLITCRWCTGVWVAAGVVVAREVAPRWWRPVRDGLAIASAAALVAGLEQD